MCAFVWLFIGVLKKIWFVNLVCFSFILSFSPSYIFFSLSTLLQSQQIADVLENDLKNIYFCHKFGHPPRRYEVLFYSLCFITKKNVLCAVQTGRPSTTYQVSRLVCFHVNWFDMETLCIFALYNLNTDIFLFMFFSHWIC